MCCKHGNTNYNAPILWCCAANIINQCFVAAKKFAKSNFWCCMLSFLIQLVQLARFHKYICAANIPVIPVVLVFPAFWSFHLPDRSIFSVVLSSRSFQLPGRSIFPVIPSSRSFHLPGHSIFPVVPSSRSFQLPGRSGFPVGSRPCKYISLSVVPIIPVIPGQFWKA